MIRVSIKRHIIKTISYRILGSLTTIFVSFCLGISLKWSVVLGASELIVKPLIYFFHERIWDKYSKYGIEK
jgi:uncharacterized membrane protein